MLPAKAPGVGGLVGHFLVEPDRPLGLLRASISYSLQPVFNTKRGKGGIKGAWGGGVLLRGGWGLEQVEGPCSELL